MIWIVPSIFVPSLSRIPADLCSRRAFADPKPSPISALGDSLPRNPSLRLITMLPPPALKRPNRARATNGVSALNLARAGRETAERAARSVVFMFQGFLTESMTN